MKYLLKILLIASLGWGAQSLLALPWWSLMIVAFAVAAALPGRTRWDFASGFVAGALLWGIAAGVVNSANDSILADRIVRIFKMGGGIPQLIIQTALVGGFAAAFAAATGTALRKMLQTDGAPETEG